MAATRQPDTETLASIADSLREYATCVCFTEWLRDNNILRTDTATDTRPEVLAYGFAVRFSHQKDRIDAILGGDPA